MPLSLSDEAKEELGRPKPNITATAKIIKNYYATQTVIDVTGYVISYGRYRNRSSLACGEWELPNMTIQFENRYGYFREGMSTSVWNTSPSKSPRECVLLATLLVHTASGSEKISEFLGRVLDVIIHADEAMDTAELKCVFEPGNFLQEPCSKKDGPWTQINVNDGSTSDTRHNKGAWSVQSPDFTAWVGASDSAPFNVLAFYLGHISATFHMEVEEETILERYRPQTSLEVHDLHTGAVSKLLKYQWLTKWLPNETQLYLWNPPGWDEYNPALILADFLWNFAGLAYGMLGDYAGLSSYFENLTTPLHLKCSLWGKTFAEHVMELMGYAPEMYLYWTATSSKLEFARVKAYSTESNPYVIGPGRGNFIAIESLGRNEEKLATTIRTQFHAEVEEDTWFMERDISTGVRAPEPNSAIEDYSREDDASGTHAKMRRREIKRPWFNAGSSNFDDRVKQFHETWFALFADSLHEMALRCPAVVAQVEQGDIVAFDMSRQGYYEKKFLVYERTVDFDTSEIVLGLLDLELT